MPRVACDEHTSMKNVVTLIYVGILLCKYVDELGHPIIGPLWRVVKLDVSEYNAMKLDTGYGAFCFKKHKCIPPTTNCQMYNTKLLYVVTEMCINIANGTNATLQDACLGCFQTAITAANNQPSLPALAACATRYLPNTNYSSCILHIQGAAANGASFGPNNCVSGYCGFVRCVRDTNADITIARCYNASIALNNATFPNQVVILYKNITSCILAFAKCGIPNAITGEPYITRINTTTYNKCGFPVSTTSVPVSNALQITPSGSLRVISIPTTTALQPYFCGSQNNLQQSTWMNVTCT